jgi:uncharacterized membrane protein YdjX (TVP38/TMEM64 family)
MVGGQVVRPVHGLARAAATADLLQFGKQRGHRPILDRPKGGLFPPAEWGVTTRAACGLSRRHMNEPETSSRHGAHHALLFGGRKQKRALWLLALIGLIFGAIAVSLIAFTRFDWTSVTRVVEHLNPFAVVPLMAVLPVAGFPIVVVYLVAGARFGPIAGGVIVAGVTAVHLLLSYAITKSFLRRPLHRLVARRHAHLPVIPDDEHAAVALIGALVPGIPYVVRNYLLALAGLRFRIYFWVLLPIYVARSYATILIGDLSSDPSRARLFILLGVDGLKVVVCAFVIWRLREHHRRYHGDGASALAPPSGEAR